MNAETVGLVGIVIAQIAMFAKMVFEGKTKARESHLLSVETGFIREQKRQDEETARMRAETHDLRRRVELLDEAEQKCRLEKVALETRLALLEHFNSQKREGHP